MTRRGARRCGGNLRLRGGYDEYHGEQSRGALQERPAVRICLRARFHCPSWSGLRGRQYPRVEMCKTVRIPQLLEVCGLEVRDRSWTTAGWSGRRVTGGEEGSEGVVEVDLQSPSLDS